MAIPAPTEVSVAQVHIPNSKYIILDAFPGENHKQLITKTKNYEINGYMPLGCQFPDTSKREPWSTEALQYISNHLLGNIVYAARTSDAKSDSITHTREIQLLYGWVQGAIQIDDETVVREETGRYFPIKDAPPGPDITVDFNPLLYYVGKSTTDDIGTIRVFIIQKVSTFGELTADLYQEYVDNEATADIPKYVVVEEVTDTVANSIIEDLTNEKIAFKRDTAISMAEFNDSTINDIIATDRIISGTFTQTTNISIYACILSSTELDLTASDIDISLLDTTINHNYHFLKQGWAAYINNSSYIFSQTATAEETAVYNTIVSKYIDIVPQELIDAGLYAEDSSIGMYISPYWKRHKQETMRFPTSVSFSALKQYMTCKYQYFADKYEGNRYSRYDDKVDSFVIADTNHKGPLYLGIIAHYAGEELVKAIMTATPGRSPGDSVPAAAVQLYSSMAQQHFLGYQIDAIDAYSFTATDVKSLPNSYVRQSIAGIRGQSPMNTWFENINNRDYYSGYDTFISEFELDGAYYDATVNGITKRIYITGFIDGILYNSSTDRTAIFDLKSNKQKFTYKHATKEDDNGAYQVVWYLHFLQQISPFNYGGELIHVPTDTLDNTSISTFFDFIRYEDDAILDIAPSEREAIWTILEEKLNELATDVVTYEADTTQNPADIFIPTKYKYCSSCPIHASCPHPNLVGNKDMLRRKKMLNEAPAKTITRVSTISSQPWDRDDDDDVSAIKHIKSYADIATGTILNDRLSELTRTTIEEHRNRARQLYKIDAEYKTQIGAIYVTSPITNIQMVDSKRHEIYNTLRSPAPTVFRTEGTDKIATITIRFNSAEKINTEMRHIIAQYTAFPFVSIRNPDITRTFVPYDTHRDIYYAAGGDIRKLVRRYIQTKQGDYRDRPDILISDTPASIKQRIYESVRLFYGITDISVSAVSDAVDTMDLTMRLQLHDVFATTSNGKISYLMDTHSVMMQLAWTYNANISTIDTDVSRTLKNMYYETLVLGRGSSSANEIVVIFNSGEQSYIDVTGDTTYIYNYGDDLKDLDYSANKNRGNHMPFPIKNRINMVYKKIHAARFKNNETDILKLNTLVFNELDVDIYDNTTILTTVGYDPVKDADTSITDIMRVKPHLISTFVRLPINATSQYDVDVPIFTGLINRSGNNPFSETEMADNILMPFTVKYNRYNQRVFVSMKEGRSAVDFTGSFMLKGKLYQASYKDPVTRETEYIISGGFQRTEDTWHKALYVDYLPWSHMGAITDMPGIGTSSARDQATGEELNPLPQGGGTIRNNRYKGVGAKRYVTPEVTAFNNIKKILKYLPGTDGILTLLSDMSILHSTSASGYSVKYYPIPTKNKAFSMITVIQLTKALYGSGITRNYAVKIPSLGEVILTKETAIYESTALFPRNTGKLEYTFEINPYVKDVPKNTSLAIATLMIPLEDETLFFSYPIIGDSENKGFTGGSNERYWLVAKKQIRDTYKNAMKNYIEDIAGDHVQTCKTIIDELEEVVMKRWTKQAVPSKLPPEEVNALLKKSIINYTPVDKGI